VEQLKNLKEDLLLRWDESVCRLVEEKSDLGELELFDHSIDYLNQISGIEDAIQKIAAELDQHGLFIFVTRKCQFLKQMYLFLQKRSGALHRRNTKHLLVRISLTSLADEVQCRQFVVERLEDFRIHPYLKSIALSCLDSFKQSSGLEIYVHRKIPVSLELGVR
jgi:hypothetical protein